MATDTQPKRRSFVPDVGAGLTVALVSIPEGMAYSLVAGVSPIYGLYTGMVTTIIASIFVSTNRLVVTLTNALALVAGDQLVKLPPEATMQALFTLTFLVGVIMTVLGLFRLGSVIRFVSKEVMAGFVFVTALLIVLGQLKHVVGLESELDTNKLFQAFDILSRPGEWNMQATVVGVLSIGVLLALDRTPVKRFADILVIVFAAVLVLLLGWTGVEIVAYIDEVPSGVDALPRPMLPDFSMMPVLLAGAFAATVVGLSESSGVGAAYPNLDGSKSNMSKDFLGQGLGNLAGSFFQTMPAGGSLSRTGVNVSGGARTRLSGMCASIMMIVILFFFGNLAELIPLTGLGALLTVIGAGVMLREGRILARAWRTSRPNTAIAGITILAGVFTDLTVAIFTGVVLSLIVYAVNASSEFRFLALTRDPDGHWREGPGPKALAPGEVAVVEMRGSANFASVYSMDEVFPDISDAQGASLILRVRDRNFESLTGVEWLEALHATYRKAGVRLVLAEVEPKLMHTLEATGLAEEIGAGNIFPASEVIFAATEAALASTRPEAA